VRHSTFCVRRPDDCAHLSIKAAVDDKCSAMHGPRVLSAVIPLSRLLHYVGFALAIGSAIAVTVARRRAANSQGAERDALEKIAGDLIAIVGIPGLFVTLVGGLLAVVANPGVLDPAGAGGPWLHIKLPLVVMLLVAMFANVFATRLLVREREHGAKEQEVAALIARGMRLDVATIAIAVAILTLTTFRFALFG
jgi:uncharacterized membrane protein